MVEDNSGLPAVVKISRRRIGVIWAFLGVFGGVVAGWQAGWPWSLLFLVIMLPVAVLFYSGISRESNISVARGRVFVYPKTVGNETTALSESVCKPEAIKEEGDAVPVLSRWSELRIVFHTEGEKVAFPSEVSGLLKPKWPVSS